jgi:hypothetical protein
MRPTAFYFFEYVPPGAKKPKVTTYRMTIEEAADRLPGAVPVEWSKEIRNLPEPGDTINGGLGFLARPAPAELDAQKEKAPPPGTRPSGGA